MRNFYLICFLFLINFTFGESQCPWTSGTVGTSAVRWLNTGLLTINWTTMDSATVMFNKLDSITANGNILGFTGMDTTLTKVQLQAASGTRIRPLNSSHWDNNGSSGQFTGYLKFYMTTGTLTCNYASGVLTTFNLVLPVELINYEARPYEKSVMLGWSTATETNNDYFTIERSADGSNFAAIGMVNGAGNSSSSIDYSYIDDAPLAGTSYYRLKQTDYDGQFSYSDVRAVQFSAGKSIKFAYDTQGEEIRIQSSISDLSVRIVDMAGRVLKTIPAASSLTQVSVSDLQAGTYVVIIAGSSGVSETFKFVR